MAILTVERRLVVAVDVDETLSRFQEGVADFARERWGIIYPVDQIHPDPYQNQDDKLAEIIMEFLRQQDRVEQLRPYHGAKKGLRMLHEEGYDPYLVSARRASILGGATESWVEAHGFRPYLAGIHLRNDGCDSGPSFKVLKAQELGVVALFDDDGIVAQRCAENGIPVFRVRPNHRAPVGEVNHPLISSHSTFLLGVQAFLNFAKLKTS